MMFFGGILALFGLSWLAYQLGWLPQGSIKLGGSERPETALEINRRYARGEINREEYQEIRQELQKSSS